MSDRDRWRQFSRELEPHCWIVGFQINEMMQNVNFQQELMSRCACSITARLQQLRECSMPALV